MKAYSNYNRSHNALRNEVDSVQDQGFDFGEQGNKVIYFKGTREEAPPLGGPQYICGISHDRAINQTDYIIDWDF